MVEWDARFGLHGALNKKYFRVTHMLFLHQLLVPKVNYCFRFCFRSSSSCMYNEVWGYTEISLENVSFSIIERRWKVHSKKKQMILCRNHVFAFLSFVISISSAKRGDNGFEYDTRPAAMCSYAGNCTCELEKLGVVAKCTFAGDKIKRIASELPQTTKHL